MHLCLCIYLFFSLAATNYIKTIRRRKISLKNRVRDKCFQKAKKKKKSMSKRPQNSAAPNNQNRSSRPAQSQQQQQQQQSLTASMNNDVFAFSSILPPKEEYTVLSASSAQQKQTTIHSPASQQFAGVRVSRGTLAVFGDDTAKQFALHVDKMLKDRNTSANNTNAGLLVRGGDLSQRTAFLQNDKVKVFEENMNVLLNSSLRQREIRQRDNDNAVNVALDNNKNKKKNGDDDDGDDQNDSSDSSNEDDDSSVSSD